ncbi:MAG: hypothetical protein WC608_00810 [Parcubacteria group bacterium]
MSIVDKVREAIKKKNSEGEEKGGFNLSGSDEDKIREFETRAREVDNIMEKMEEAGINTGEVTSEIRNIVKDII